MFKRYCNDQVSVTLLQYRTDGIGRHYKLHQLPLFSEPG